jgi:protein SCO1
MKQARRLMGLALALLLLSAASLPRTEVFDQSGRRFALDQLVAGKTVTYAFIFTGCSSSCPLIGQKIAQVQRQLGAQDRAKLLFVGVSVDPLGDTPAAMRRFGTARGLGAGWHFVNGNPGAMEQLRNVLGGGAPMSGHVNYLLVRNERTGASTRIDALSTDAATIARRIAEIAGGTPRRAEGTARYFGAGPLVTSEGRRVEFYRDVLAGQVTLINTIFTRCVDACPLITEKLVRTQRLLGSKAAGVRFVSVSNDPAYDNAPRLAAYARTHGISGRWLVLGGPQPVVEHVLTRFNLAGAGLGSGDHGTALIIGNDRSGSWRRVSPAIEPAALARLLVEVMAEKPA